MTYSVLPVFRWQFANGQYRSLTISDSIKITRFISINLLAENILYDIQEILLMYELRDEDIEFYLMGRP
jgi:hypothetical protein